MKRALLLAAAAVTACSASLDPGSVSCRNDGECATGWFCTPGGTCAAGPACGAGQTLCHDTCVDPQTSLANCGACNHACNAPANGTASCAAGTCGFSCTSPAVQQGSGCLLPPNAPQALAATPGTSVSLSWALQSDATSYDVLRATAAAGPFDSIASPTTNAYLDATAAPGTLYFYEIVARNLAGASSASAPVSALTPPGAPAGLTASLDGTGAKVVLTWEAAHGADSYDVYRGQSIGSETFYANVTSAGFTDTAAPAGLTNFYRVLAKNASGSSTLTADVSQLTVPAAPATFSATPNSDGSVTLSWAGTAGATGFTIFRDSATLTSVGPAQVSYNDAPGGGTSHQYEVAAFNVSGAGPHTSGQTVLTRPDAPANVLASLDAGKISITLSWNHMPGAASYDVYRNTTSGLGSLLTNVADPGSGSVSYSDNAPDRGVTDYYIVVAKNASGASPNSSETSALTVPLAPTAVSATANADGSVTVTWTAPAGATSFAVFRDAAQVSTTAGGASSPFSDTPPAGGTYAYAVTAANASGSGPASGAQSATTAPPVATLSLGTVSAAGGVTTVNLSWTRANGATSYSLYRDGTSFSTVADPGSGASAGTSVTDSSRATTRSFKVFATNAGGSSAASNVISVTTEPNDPTGLAPGNVTTNSVTLTWNRSSGATSYNLLRGAPGAETLLTAVADPGAGTTVQYVDNTAQPSTQYGYEVAATNNGGSLTSGASAEATATTATPVPTGLTVAATDDTHLTLTWNRIAAGVDSYDILRGPITGGESATPVTNVANPAIGATVVFADSGLSANTPYYYEVVGRKSTLTSAPGSEANARTRLPPVTGLVVGSPHDGDLTLTWNKPAGGPYKYAVYRGLASGQDVGFSFTTLPDDGNPGTETFTDGLLEPGTSYFYRVQTVTNGFTNTAVVSGEASGTTTNTGGPGLSLTALDNTHVSVDVFRQSGYDYYEFFRSQTNGTPVVTAPPAAVTLGAGTDINFTDTVGATGTWFYAVRGRYTSTGTAGPWSPVQSVTVLSGKPPTPTGFFPVAAGSNEVLLQWDVTNPASSYTVLRSSSGVAGTCSTIATVTTPYYADVGSSTVDPRSGNTYFYQLQANNAAGSSTATASISATVDASAFATMERNTAYSNGAPVTSGVLVGGRVTALDGTFHSFQCIADGHCLANNVPAAPAGVFVKRGQNQIFTTLRTMDLSSDSYGRADAQPLNTTTPVSFTLSNLASWSVGSSLEFTSTNVPISANTGFTQGLEQIAFAGAPNPGDTQLTGFTVDALSWFMQVVTSKGDQPRLVQLSPFTSSTGVPYSTPTRVYQGFTMSQVDGRPQAMASGAFTNVTPVAHAVKYLRSRFKALAPQINPSAAPEGVADFFVFQAVPYDASGGAHPFAQGGATSPADLFIATLDTGTSDVDFGTISLGNPYPSNTGANGYYADANIQGTFTAPVHCNTCGPGGTSMLPLQAQGSVSTIDSLANVLAEAASTGLQPHMTPVLSPQITSSGDGKSPGMHSLFDDNTGVGLTPTFSWTAPSGTIAPNYYRIFVYQIGDDGSGTGVAAIISPNGPGNPIAQLYTTALSLQVPAGILTAGNTYFIDIRPTYEPGRDIINAPFLRGSREYFVDMVSNSFVP